MSKISAFLIFSLLLNIVCESAMARAGGRSSFGGGRSSTSYSNQGSRGSRSFQGGGADGKNYAPMQRSKSADANNSTNSTAAKQNQQDAAQAAPRQNPVGSFFQRNPFLATFGTALAASWLGHMLFGGSGFGGFGGGSGGFLTNFILMFLGAMLVMFLVRRFTKKPSDSCATSFGSTVAEGGFDPSIQSARADFSQTPIVNIILPEGEKNKFSAALVEIQKAWSNQDIETLKKLASAEMVQYFSESLKQNVSQQIVNKVEEIEVTMVQISESWREVDLEYVTAILEWSSLDYMINLNKTPQDPDYIAEGGNKNLVITSEAWTFLRHGSNGNWILSAIAQIEK